MGWINACSYVARMASMHIAKLPAQCFIHRAVRFKFEAIYTKHAVSMDIEWTSPNPASSLCNWLIKLMQFIAECLQCRAATRSSDAGKKAGGSHLLFCSATAPDKNISFISLIAQFLNYTPIMERLVRVYLSKMFSKWKFFHRKNDVIWCNGIMP